MPPADYRPRLKELRQASGLARWQLETVLGVERLMFRCWERGHAPIPDELLDPLADRFGVTMSYLMGWEWGGDLSADDADMGAMTAAESTEEERVLREASDALREWSERLPDGSAWSWGFADISRIIGECA